MAKLVSKKRKSKGRATPECVFTILPLCMLKRSYRSNHSTPSRWRILPPEITHIIVELLKDDKDTLHACSLASREFSCPALSYIGRHITINHVPRIKQCMELLTAHSAFQHVSSLDLGVTSKSSNPEDYLEEQLTILGIFARRQTLTCLWLSNVPFPSIGSSQEEKIQDVVTALSSTVDNLGLYGCRFLSYADMISFIRAFPRCNSLYIRDCVTTSENPAENMFLGLPEHKLSLTILELTSTSSNRRIVDVSSLVGDAGLDVSQLSALTCCFGSAEQARCVAMATSASRIQHFQLACTESGGFQGACEVPNDLYPVLSFSRLVQAFLNPMVKRWPLESLTIGPLYRRTNRAFWHDTFKDFPTVTQLKELTIIYYYPNANAFDTSCWVYLNSLFCQRDIFPLFTEVDIRATIQSSPLNNEQRLALYRALGSLSMRRTVKIWGKSEWSLFRSALSISPDYHARNYPLVVTVGTEASLVTLVPLDMASRPRVSRLFGRDGFLTQAHHLRSVESIAV